MKLSMGSWAFSFGPYADDPVPFDRVADRLAAAGYDGVEISGSPPHITLEQYPTRQSRRELASFLSSLNLGVSGYNADFTAVNPLTPGNRRSYLDLCARQIEMCVDIGSPALRVDTVAAPELVEPAEREDAVQRLAALWHDVSEAAQRAGIKIVWEFEPAFAFNKPSEIVRVYELVGHSNFSILFDTAHAYTCGITGARQQPPVETLPGGVAEFMHLLYGRIGAIHLVDSDGALHAEETSAHRPLGRGKIDFPKLLPQLLAVPGVEWWCIDLCFCPEAWALVESSRQYVLDLLKRRVAA